MSLVATQIAWETSLPEVRERALREAKAILLDFNAAPECKGCVALDSVAYADHGVVQFIEQHFIPARIAVHDRLALVEEYLVSWTPNVVITDAQGKVHYRIEGFLPAEEFMAHLSLGIGKYRLNRRQFKEAAERFEEVDQRHAGSDAGAEALYWLGVAQYRATNDLSKLHASWDKLTQEYADSEWAKRAAIPEID